MGRPGSRPPELALPVASLAAIRRSLTDEVGANGAARALRAAGHAAGDALFAALTQPFGGDGGDADGSHLSEVSVGTFWRRLSQLFSTRGWGALMHEQVHDGLAALESPNWVEAEPNTTNRPSCFFTTGLLANLLGRSAGSEIAVLEIECRSRGDDRCRFLFGAPETLETVYTRLRSGESIESSVAAHV
ncbi:MAG TPA: 4-vinyl reductase [Longimicrobiales bacterium]|nr:4-vinyl reductase [Longimicrobiales bacterium]